MYGPTWPFLLILIVYGPGVVVEYTKEHHLYRILVPSAHILLSFCIRIGAFDRSCVFGLVQVFRVPCIIVIGVRVQSECRSLRMMVAAVEKSWEVRWCWGTVAEAVVPVPGKPVPVPQSKKSPVAKWYRYQANRYRYPKAEIHQ